MPPSKRSPPKACPKSAGESEGAANRKLANTNNMARFMIPPLEHTSPARRSGGSGRRCVYCFWLLGWQRTGRGCSQTNFTNVEEGTLHFALAADETLQ